MVTGTAIKVTAEFVFSSEGGVQFFFIKRTNIIFIVVINIIII